MTGNEEIEITGNSVNTILEQKLLKHSKKKGISEIRNT
jgi:hypothetical protein